MDHIYKSANITVFKNIKMHRLSTWKEKVNPLCLHGTKKCMYLYKDNVKAHSASWVKLIEAVTALCKWDFLQFLGLTKCFEHSLIW